MNTKIWKHNTKTKEIFFCFLFQEGSGNKKCCEEGEWKVCLSMDYVLSSVQKGRKNESFPMTSL
jgi:hypothetical protein